MKLKTFDKRAGALEALYRTQAVRLRNILRAKFGGSHRSAGNDVERRSTLGVQDVDDLIQDVFARVLASGDGAELDELREPAAYLITVARNLVVDSVRRRQRVALVESSFQSSEPKPPERAPFEDPEFHERCVEAVAAYVAGLPPELSSAFDTRFTRDMSQRDAAVALGVTRRRVRTLEERLVAGAARELEAALRTDAARSDRRDEGPVDEPAGEAEQAPASNVLDFSLDNPLAASTPEETGACARSSRVPGRAAAGAVQSALAGEERRTCEAPAVASARHRCRR